MPDWSKRRKCPGCPADGWVEPGVEHTRCDACRESHRKSKEADAQWDRRARRRAEKNAERVRKGQPAWPDSQVRPRERTPDWDRYGREVPGTPRLTPTQAQALRYALDRLDQAVAGVRAALDPPPHR